MITLEGEFFGDSRLISAHAYSSTCACTPACPSPLPSHCFLPFCERHLGSQSRDPCSQLPVLPPPCRSLASQAGQWQSEAREARLTHHVYPDLKALFSPEALFGFRSPQQLNSIWRRRRGSVGGSFLAPFCVRSFLAFHPAWLGRSLTVDSIAVY